MNALTGIGSMKGFIKNIMFYNLTDKNNAEHDNIEFKKSLDSAICTQNQ